MAYPAVPYAVTAGVCPLATPRSNAGFTAYSTINRAHWKCLLLPNNAGARNDTET